MTEPRLKSLVVRDFRSISGEWTIPLDADVVLIHGQNGAGKTSLLSALELAVTGTISYLDHIGDSDYHGHLHHRGRESGQVTLETTGLAGANLGSAFVNGGGVDVQPLLDERLREAFVERCFLPQATLSRLFEVYTPQGGKSSDTALIRFVKELLGLDSLDSLIDGLFSSGHIKRIEKLSRGWQRASDHLAELRKAMHLSRGDRIAAQSRSDELVAELATRLGVNDATERPEEAFATLIGQMVAARAEDDADAARVHELLLRLDAVETTLVQNDLIGADPNQTDSKSGLVKAEARLAAWESTRAAPLRRWFAENALRDETVGEVGPATMLNTVRRRLEEAEVELDALRTRNVLRRNRMDKVSATRSKLVDVEVALERLAGQRTDLSTSTAAASLASALVSMLDHVDGDECPVCDQQFRTGGSLRDHVVSKARSLDADAARLIELETQRALLESEQNALKLALAGLESNDVDASEEQADESDGAARLGELRALEAVGEAGLLLAEDVFRLQDMEAQADRGRSLLKSCLSELQQMAEILGVEHPTGLIAQRLAALRAIARTELDVLERGQRDLATILRLKSEYEAASVRLAMATERESETQEEMALLASEIDEARRRKEVGSGLRKKAEELRTSTITRVFDEHLNGSWARIFGALVPSEPFVPQFKRIPEGTRQVAVEVETVHRDGLEAATPAAMLSQGNLNTAALSLFVALHFAVPAELPWLIFDDPVQSMDDLHVSNFAALVKQLTRRNGRQVVIAVHERELFDYLALELTPASPDEELLTVVLDRTYGRSVVVPSRRTFEPDTALTPTSAA